MPMPGAVLEPIPWRIISKAFREDLAWAVVLPGDAPITAAVRQLLDEMAARGITAAGS